jgi:drug/metabolite transporter (DMT)-like permease
LAGIIAGNGAPYAFIAAEGLHYAPVYDAGALNPAMMPLFVALIAATVLHEQPPRARKLGLVLIASGALTLILSHDEPIGILRNSSRTLGDGLFLLASFLTAVFTVLTRRARLDPIHAVALCLRDH